MPKKPAKKAAPKKTAAKKPSGPRRAAPKKKAAPTPKKAAKPVRRAVRAPQRHVLGQGSVSLNGPGRIRWECVKLNGGIGLSFVPSGVRVDQRRVSLSLVFRHPPTGATSNDYQPKVEDRVVLLQFQTFPGWERGFKVEVQGVDEAPVIS